ncbi:MAG: hypothetical protein ACI4J8_06435, partial [Oscillospiraceae bacterium]
ALRLGFVPAVRRRDDADVGLSTACADYSSFVVLLHKFARTNHNILFKSDKKHFTFREIYDILNTTTIKVVLACEAG